MIRVGALVLVLGLLVMVVPSGAQRDPDAPVLDPLPTFAIYEQVSDSVVQICPVVEGVVTNECGSGVIIDVQDYRGTIATNAHVLRGADAAQVRLSDGEVHEVQGALAMHAAIDIMLITIAAPDLKAASLSDSGAIAIGQEVIVVSSPDGYLNTVSESIIAGCRVLNSINSDFQFPTDRYQLDGGIAPGSSGGGVFNRAGELVGLPVSAIAPPVISAAGGVIKIDTDIDFVVPSPFVKWLYDNQSDRPVSVPQARRLQDLYRATLQIMRTLSDMGTQARNQADLAEQALNAVELNFRDPEFYGILTHEIDMLRQVGDLSDRNRELQREALANWVPQLVQPGAVCDSLSPRSAHE